MKTKVLILSTILSLVTLTNSCKKKDNNTSTTPTPTPTPVTPTNTAIPVVLTTTIKNITDSTATTGGTVTAEGNGVIIQVGVCWDEQPNPTLLRSKTLDGAGVGTYTSQLSGLKPNTTYYVRAYATNVSGTAYGAEISFKTTAPVVLKDWIDMSNGLNGGAGMFITPLNSDLFTTNGGQIVKSTGGGNNWVPSNQGISPFKSTYEIVVKNGELFAAVFNGGIYHSSDAGQSWAPRNSGITDSTILDIEIVGTDLYIINNLDKNIYKSSDNANSWTVINLPPGLGSPDQLASNSNALFFVDSSTGYIYSSTDNGANWTQHNGPNGGWAKLKGYGSKLYGCTQTGLYVSSDNASTWTKLSNSLGNNPVSSFLIDNGTFYIGSQYSVYSSTDNGATWNKIAKVLPNSATPVAMIVVNNSLYVVGTWNATKIYKLDLN